MKKISIQTLIALTFSTLNVGCSQSSFDATVDDQGASVLKSQIIVPGDGFADGTSAVEVTLVLKNWKDEPVSGVVMEIEVSGTGNTIMPCTMSDWSGRSRCRFFSTTPGQKVVSVKNRRAIQGMTQMTTPPPSSSAFAVVTSYTDESLTPGGPRLIAASGISESDIVKVNQWGSASIVSSILGSILYGE